MPLLDGPQPGQKNRERLARLGLNDPLGYVDGANVYEFVHDDPATRTDPTGLYDWAGHYYTTYITTLISGMSDAQARELAYWSEYPDFNNLHLDAIDALSNYPLGVAERIQNYLHSLTDNPAKRRCVLTHLLQQPGLQPWQRGLLLHALGDAYAHSWELFGEHGFPPPLGHAIGGHAPDYIGNAPSKWQSYVQNLYGLLGGGPNNPALGNFLSSAPSRPALTFLDDFWLGNAENQSLINWAAAHGYQLPSENQVEHNPNYQFGQLTMDQVNSVMNMIEQAEKSDKCCK